MLYYCKGDFKHDQPVMPAVKWEIFTPFVQYSV